MAFAVLVFAMFTYNNAPTGREQLPHDVAIACIAFLFGKFTNGFTRKKPTRWDDDPIAKMGGVEANGQDNASTSVVLDYSAVETTDTGSTTRRGARYSNVRRE